MAVAEELQIIIDAKVSQAVKDLKKIDSSLGKNEKSSNSLMNTFKKLAGPVAIGAVIAKTIRMGKEFSKAASDAEETQQHQHALDMERIQVEAEATLVEIQAKAQAEAFKQRGDAENNVAQSSATTQQEIEKSVIQSQLKIREMVTKSAADLETMRAKKNTEVKNDGDKSE